MTFIEQLFITYMTFKILFSLKVVDLGYYNIC